MRENKRNERINDNRLTCGGLMPCQWMRGLSYVMTYERQQVRRKGKIVLSLALGFQVRVKPLSKNRWLEDKNKSMRLRKESSKVMLYETKNRESDCEIAVKAWVYELPEWFQKIAVKAITDLREEEYSWEWIETALKKKSVGQWVKYGTMGLLWNDSFQASVWRQLDRNHESQNINIDGFLDCKTEIQEYLAEIKRLGD